MKKTFCFFILSFLYLNLFAQNIEPKPLDEGMENHVQSIILANQVNDFFESGNIKIGSFYIGDVLRFLSFNPVEGARIRLGGGLNLDNGFSVNAFGAVGTKDKQFKYSVDASYRFSIASNVQNTVTITHCDNTYLAYLSSYDHILNSLWSDTNFFMMKIKMYGINNSTNFLFETSKLKIDAGVSRNSKWKVQTEEGKKGIVPTKANFIYPTLQFSWSQRSDDAAQRVIVSRYRQFENSVSLLTAGEFFVWDDDVSDRFRIILSGQKRIPFSDYRYGCLDLAFDAGFISKDVSRGGLFYPITQIGYVSRSYIFLLAPYYRFANTEYASVIMGLNSGGMILNNIDFFRKFHGNEFLTFKTYFSEYDPYYEVSFGVDNILNLLGFELAYSSLNKFGAFLRLKVSF